MKGANVVGESNYDRAYLMALSAWKTFGYTSEPQKMFARRIAVIGEAQGVSVAAEAIAEDCRQHGLEMSAARVLKSLSHALQQNRDQLSRLKSIEDFRVEEVGKLPPAIVSLFEGEAAPRKVETPWGWILVVVVVVLVFVGWLILR
jgi:hypothetical protein